MLDETSLARLAEMGIDVYVPRGTPGLRASVIASALPPGDPLPDRAGPATHAVHGRVLVLATIGGTGHKVLMANVVRALRFARIETRPGDVDDEAALVAASALIVFGDTLVRGVGAVLPAQRQREIGFVVAGDLDTLAGDARAKRALWSELRRLARARSAAGHRDIDAATRRG